MVRAVTHDKCGSCDAVTLRRAVELWCASRLAFNQDDFHQAERLAQEGLELFRKLDDKRGVGLALLRLGDVASRRHNHQKACLLLEESVTILRKWGFKTNLAYSLSSFAPVLSEQGKYTRACVLAEESLALFRELNHLGGVAHALCCLAKAHLLQGEYHSARIVGEEGLAIARKLGMKSIIASSLQLLGQVALHQGDGATARTLLMESLAIKRESGSRWTYAELLILLGSIVAFQRDDTQANSLFKESLAILKDLNDAEMVASVLENVAEAVLAQGSPTWSARLWGAAHSMREAIGALLPLDKHSSHKRAMIAARTQLGKDTFTVAYAEGLAMSLEQVLDAQQAVISRKQVSPAVASVTFPSGLTQREVEVLRLVAKGLTIAQIAEQLIISFHTANAHVRTIYNKLDVTSRSAATRYAIEHHLV